MTKKRKSFIGAIALTAALLSSVCFSGCAPANNGIAKLDGDISGTVTSNGGFVVEKGDYVYFINGKESYTASNAFNDVTKGALMRIAKTDLTAGNYGEAETVVPLLMVSQDYTSGVYIYGDYVYFATPTADKDMSGNVVNTSLDFKRAKLDGTETMSGYYFRSSDNAGQFRFVELGEGENKAVYCIYEENDVLKSFNTVTGQKNVLVSGTTDYYFDQTDKESGKVYYTMSVTDKIDSDKSSPYGYNQIYCVTPDATATVNATEASYTVHNAAGENYRTYDFDKTYMDAQNLDAKNNKEDQPYDFGDYSTYPYVNLGELVLDGIGSSSNSCPVTVYNNADDVTAVASQHTELKGYSYTVQGYENGGVYFTRSTVLEGTAGLDKVYYLADSVAEEAGWNTVKGNFDGETEVVSLDTAKASVNALYTYESGVHTYFYVSGNYLYKATEPTYDAGTAQWTETDPIRMAYGVEGATLLFIEGDYLYYYASSSTNLSRIKHTGTAQSDYDVTYGNEDYKAVNILQIQFNTEWYIPEFVGNVLLYNNVYPINDVTYNYVYAVNLTGEDGGMMTTSELVAFNEKYTEVVDEFIGETADSELKGVLDYVFRTGSMEAFTDVEDLYSAYQIEEAKAFYEHRLSTNKSATDYSTRFKDDAGNYYDRETYFINLVGAVSTEDSESIADGWAATLIEREEETEETFPVWAIVLISVGGALIVAAAITVPCVMQYKKKKKARADREATAVRKRKTIDTTDDKSIDVYADERAEQPVEATETTADESAETPVTEQEEVSEQPSEDDAETSEETQE